MIRKSMIVVCLSLLFACSKKPSQGVPLQGEACIGFIDMSNSLSDEAFEQEIIGLGNIFLKLTDTGCYVRVFPLHGDTGRNTSPLIDCYLSPNEYTGNVRSTNEYTQARINEWKKYEAEIRSYRKSLKDKDGINGITRGGPLNYTCILKGFFYIDQFYGSIPNVNRKQLIFISDMLEDCPRTGIDMDKSADDFRKAQVAVSGQLKKATYLQGVEIKIIIPGTATFSTLPAWLDDETLLNFWKSVFLELGAIDDSKISYETVKRELSIK